MRLAIRRGLRVALAGAPEQKIGVSNPVSTVGFLGSDHVGLRVDVLVEEGQAVRRGDAVFRDRKRHDIQFTAPIAGTVSRIELEPGHRLKWIELTVSDGDARRFPVPETPERDGTRHLLLESGLWTSFRSRPFGRIPDADAVPDAIFITATDTEPHAADPSVVVAQCHDDLVTGTDWVRRLTDGPVFICQPGDADFVREDDQLRCVHVSGPHPAGLAGTHVDRLFPVIAGKAVWTINYQDVIAIGELVRTGEISGERVIAVAGPAVNRPHLVRVPAGADIDDLVGGKLNGPAQVLSGSAVSGRHSRFLGRHHWQVSALPRKTAHGPAHTMPRWWHHFLDRPGRPGAVVPTAALDHALGADIPVVPLLRALSIGDSATADRLGCRGLLEEDVAPMTYAAGGRHDFGVLLRSVLDELEET